MVRVRAYYQLSTGQWLARTDANSPLSTEEALAHAAAEYELDPSDLTVTEGELTAAEVEALRSAAEWSGEPPALPEPDPAGEARIAAPVREPEPDPVVVARRQLLAQWRAQLEGVTTLAQLRAALVEILTTERDT